MDSGHSRTPCASSGTGMSIRMTGMSVSKQIGLVSFLFRFIDLSDVVYII